MNPSKTMESFVDAVKIQMQIRNVSVRKLTKQIQSSPTTVQNFLSGKNVGLIVVCRALSALKISPAFISNKGWGSNKRTTPNEQ